MNLQSRSEDLKALRLFRADYPTASACLIHTGTLPAAIALPQMGEFLGARP